MPRRLAGVDEVGRGPLAGPVVAGAVVMPPRYKFGEITDSKKLSPEKRDILAAKIQRDALAWCCVAVGPRRIEQWNIRQATCFAMTRALRAVRPDFALIDGNMSLPIACDQKTVIGGDLLIPLIGAASIIAKVWRDNLMRSLHEKYPDYGFNSHVGYGTPAHRQALERLGPCRIHRRTFAPVRDSLSQLQTDRRDGRESSIEVLEEFRI